MSSAGALPHFHRMFFHLDTGSVSPPGERAVLRDIQHSGWEVGSGTTPLDIDSGAGL